MNYTNYQEETQLQLSLQTSFLSIPNNCDTFINTQTTVGTTQSDRDVFCISGYLDDQGERQQCIHCNNKMHINQRRDVYLRHLPIGEVLSIIHFEHIQYLCPHCNKTKMHEIPFKSKCHTMTVELEQYVLKLLGEHKLTLKTIAERAGLGLHTVRDMDSKRMDDKHTIDGKTLRKPEVYAKRLAIDEFKLHTGHQYATHIIDLDSGYVLWIAKGKKKQVVYDFIEHVGLEWMDHVEAIACDMNSDFQEAFEDKCPHLQVVYDYFHIIKNFNDKVISAIRKDEQKRLIEEGNFRAAKALKHSRYIVLSSKETLERKDEQAKNQDVIKKGSELFQTNDILRKEGYLKRYKELLKENELLVTVDIIKDKLRYAYTLRNEDEMVRIITEIVELCEMGENKHLMWFSRLILNHFEGIIAHAMYPISSGKIEGINNKIKTIRRQAYGYVDDKYFFLKIIDMSRVTYIRNPKSHKISH